MSFEALHRRDERIASTSVNRVDATRRSALHGAHSLREFQSLIAQGLFPDLLDDHGDTPIDELFADFSDDFCARRRAAALSSTLVATSCFGLGSNANWQLGNSNDSVASRPRQSVGVSDVTALASSSRHSLALARRGASICGSDDNSIPRLGRGAGVRTLLVFESMSQLRRVIRIAVTETRSAVVTADNRVFAWGHGARGQLGIGDGVTTAASPTLVSINGAAIDVALSATHTVVSTDSDVFLCGQNTHCQLGFAEKSAVVWKPRPIVSFHGQCAHMIGANSTATIVVFGPSRTIVQIGRSQHDAHGANGGDDDFDDDDAKWQHSSVELRRPVPTQTDNQRIWVIGCDQLLPERMYLGKPFNDGPKAAAPATSPVQQGEWQQVQAAPKKAIADRERASCASLLVNDDLIAFVSVDGMLYVAPTGTARLARRFEVPLRLAGVSLSARHSLLALTDSGNVYEFDWTYSPCTAWAGRLQRLPFYDAAAIVAREQHSLVACGTLRRKPRRVQVPINFAAAHAAPTNLTLTVESGEQVRVHSAVLNRACPYFAAMTSSSMLETLLATISVDAALLPTQVALAFAYFGRSLFARTPHRSKKKVGAAEVVNDDADDLDECDDVDSADRDAATSTPVQSMSVQLTAALLADLLQLADMWLMSDLSDLCVQMIGEQLTIANLFDFVEVAEALTVDLNSPHPLLLEIATFVKEHAPLVVSSQEFLAVDPQRLASLDRVIFGDDTQPSVWSPFTQLGLLGELDDLRIRQRLLRRLKLSSLVDERIEAVSKELARRGVAVPEVARTARREPSAASPSATSPSAAPTPAPVTEPHDEETFLDKAAEEFMDNGDSSVQESVDVLVDPPVVSSARTSPPPPAVDKFDIRAQLEAARSPPGGGKSKMPRWRKNSEARAAPPRQTTTSSPWRTTEQTVAMSPTSLTMIQSEQFTMSPDDPNNVFSSLPQQHTFSQVATGSPQRRGGEGPLSSAASPPVSDRNSASMRAIMDAEASATLAAELQAQFDREAAEEAWQVAMQFEAAEREQAIHNRRNAHLNSHNNNNRGRGRGGGAVENER
jgi:hypothetical protein